MPVYEFKCNACGATTSLFVRSMSAPVSGACERCGNADLSRLISRFAVLRSAGGELGGLDDDLLSGFDENDPKAMAAWARKMQSEMGEDMGPEFDEMVDRLGSGASLDDLGGMDDFGDDGDFGGLDDL